MTRLPQVSGERLIRALLKSGFAIHTRKGSHTTLVHPSDPLRRATVPVHKGKDLGKGLLHAILKQAQVSPEEIRDLL